MCQVRGALSLEGQKLLSGLHRGRELPAEQSGRPGSAVSGCRCRGTQGHVPLLPATGAR